MISVADLLMIIMGIYVLVGALSLVIRWIVHPEKVRKEIRKFFFLESNEEQKEEKR